EDVVSAQPGFIGLRKGLFENVVLILILSTYKDKRVLRADHVRRDDEALDKLMRRAREQDAVLEAAGLRLVGVDDDVARAGDLVLGRHGAPLHPGREARDAEAAQIGLLDLFEE